MKIAVIGDIHGDKDALQEVMCTIGQSVDQIYSTGDLVGYKEYPNEVIEIIRDNHIQVVQGNHDRKVGVTEHLKEVPYCYITKENIQYLLQLEEKQEFVIEGKKVLLFHSHPLTQDAYLFEEEHLLEPLASELPYDVFIFGHTHIPYVREIKGKYFINVGSVGLMKDGTTRASYATIEILENNISAEIQYIDRV